MALRLRASLLLGVLLFTLPALAIDPMPFRDDVERQRFRALADELRCMVCQNQNLADSDAPLAQDMRNEVLRMIQAGQSDAEIKSFLTDRYGEFVLYRPPVNRATWLLWFGPFILLLAGAIALFVIVRRRARALPSKEIPSEEPW